MMEMPQMSTLQLCNIQAAMQSILTGHGRFHTMQNMMDSVDKLQAIVNVYKLLMNSDAKAIVFCNVSTSYYQFFLFFNVFYFDFRRGKALKW